MKKIFFLLVTIAFGLLGRAQLKPRNSVGLSLGWQKFTFLDQHVSPLKYSTHSLFPKVGLFYNKQTDRSILNIQAAVAKGAVHPSRFGERSYKAVWSPKDSFQYAASSMRILKRLICGTSALCQAISLLTGQVAPSTKRPITAMLFPPFPGC